MSPPPLRDEARFELAMSAAMRERRNRPRALVFGAGAVLALALLAAGLGLRERAGARDELGQAQSSAASVARMLADLESMRASDAQSGDAGAGAPFPNLISTLEDLATRAGMKDRPQQPRTASDERTYPGVAVHSYFYSAVKADGLEPLLQWIRLGTQEIPGLELFSIDDLRASPEGWTMNATFRRWERRP